MLPASRAHGQPPTWAELEVLAASTEIRDRAFASGELQLRHHRVGTSERARVAELYELARIHARATHAELRHRIRAGTARGTTLRAEIEACPAEVRDHWVEEVLDIAHPPLDEPHLERELIPYVPSGVGEILHALDAVDLRPGRTLIDLGAGLGKVVMLTALLTGAHARGIELDARLAALAQAASSRLRIAEASVAQGDARSADLTGADVYYMYVPFTGAVLETVMHRLEQQAQMRAFEVCALALDARRYAWLTCRDTPSLWLDVYATR